MFATNMPPSHLHVLRPALALVLFLPEAAGWAEGPATVPPLATAVPGSQIVQIPPLPGKWWGAGDPSLFDDASSGTIYQSFSDIVPSYAAAGPVLVSIALASSGDGGRSWDRIATLAQSIKKSDDVFEMNETSSLVFDPSGEASAAYKLLWLRFLQMNGEPEWRSSWIAIRTAPSPEGPWSDARKLLAGRAYDRSDPSHPEPRGPQFELPPQMGDCIILQEPGTLRAADGFYLSINCISVDRPTGNRLELLEFTHPASGGTALEYRGKLFTYDDAARFREAYRTRYPELATTVELGASSLVSMGPRTFLLASPVTAGGTYIGCGVFEITDPETARVRRDDQGAPLLLAYVQGAVGIHRGACAYANGSAGAGVLVFQVKLDPATDPPMHPDIIATGVQIP